VAGDLIGSVEADLARQAAGRGAAAGFRAISQYFAGRRTKAAQQEGGGTSEDRRSAYDHFRRAVVEYRTDFGVLATGPPSLIGAAWSYPLHMRLLHRQPSRAAAVLDALLEVEIVGRLDTSSAAEQVIVALSEATDEFTRIAASRRRWRSVEVVSLDALDKGLADFALAVRRDLGFGVEDAP
jgi:hypothetical protein